VSQFRCSTAVSWSRSRIAFPTIFSKWELIFKDPMTTAAAIDRLVHHSIILELNLPSYRLETAKSVRQGGKA
jgi:DNA replication protein DnaC